MESEGVKQVTRPARVSRISYVYFQKPGQDAKTTVLRSSKSLATLEDAFTREFSVNEEWKPLELAWLADNLGFLIVRNLGLPRQQGVPTMERVEAEAAAVLEIGLLVGEDSKTRTMFSPKAIVVPLTSLPPMGSLEWLPSEPVALRLRSQRGALWCSVTAIPG